MRHKQLFWRPPHEGSSNQIHNVAENIGKYTDVTLNLTVRVENLFKVNISNYLKNALCGYWYTWT